MASFAFDNLARGRKDAWSAPSSFLQVQLQVAGTWSNGEFRLHLQFRIEQIDELSLQFLRSARWRLIQAGSDYVFGCFSR